MASHSFLDYWDTSDFTLYDYEHSDYTNTTSDYTSYEIQSSWAWNLTVVIIMAVFGIAANTALLLVILFNRDLRTTSNILVANLAVADLILFVFSLPSDLAHWIVTDWPDTGVGNLLCKLSGGTWVLAQVLCIASLTAVSIERYCSIRWRIQLKRTAAILAAIWAISLVFTVPVLVWAKVIRYTAQISICHILPTLDDIVSKGFLTASFVLTYLLPLLVITCCYVGMASLLTRGGAGASSEAVRARRRLAIIVLILNITFAVCWLPNHAIMLFFLYSSHEVILSISFQVFGTLLEVSHVLTYVNSCLNPVVVFAISLMHRRPLVDFLLCRLLRRKLTDVEASDRYARVAEDVANNSETEYAEEDA